MLIVGITGRSGSGKSTVSARYAQKGYSVQDGDELSRKVTAKGSECLQELTAAFGEGILHEDGTLNRKALAAKAFANSEGTKMLTDITHPHILKAFLQAADKCRKNGEKLFFLDGAVIVGSIFEKHCDKIIVLTSKNKLAISRIILRDNISKTAAHMRLNAQQDEGVLLKAADYVIENNGGEDALIAKADIVLDKLEQEAEKAGEVN